MNKLTKVIGATLLALSLFATPAHATSDPVVSVSNAATVVAGQPITFAVTIDQAGFAPTNGSQKITWTNPSSHKTNNVANYTVIPMTYASGVWTFTYTPSASEIGRTEVFQVSVPVSAARIPRTVVGAAAFTVTA